MSSSIKKKKKPNSKSKSDIRGWQKAKERKIMKWNKRNILTLKT